MAAGKLHPSPNLTAAEKTAWRALIAASPAGHLSERDRPLLESFVSLTVAQRKLAKVVAGASGDDLITAGNPAGRALTQIESIAKTLAALSNRLKLAPLSGHSAPHKAGQRDEQPKVAPLLGGLKAVK